MSAGSAKLYLFKAVPGSSSHRPFTLEENPPGIDHISFLVDNVDRTYAEIQSRGVSFVAAPEDQIWGTRAAVLHDPDGNNLYLLTWLPRKNT
jgi:catechol 2,3-dioxygenase-like lactoylglutathione lyase family enzyme